MNSVLVYCEGSAEYPHARSQIATFQDGSGGWTLPLPMRKLLGKKVSAKLTYEVSPGEYDEYRALPLIDSDLDGLPPRVDGQTEAIANKGVQLECRPCGFNLTGRGHKLDPVLDKLADAPAAEISLRALSRLM
jgi:hypothetical protein